MRLLRFTTFALTTLAAFMVVLPASASDRSARTPGVVEEAERWLIAAQAGPAAASEPSNHRASATAERAAPESAAQQPFVDFSPNATVVARDWGGSMKIVGGRTMLVDDLRPTASNRMLVARLATDARLTTFVQLGVGEWRIDPAMFPNARSYSETAGQIGTGFELRLTSNLRIAGEAQYTILQRDLHYTSDEVAPHMLAFFVAVAGRL